jgi:hypothetical protein
MAWPPVTRRDFLRHGANAGLALSVMAPLLTACSDDDDAAPGQSSVHTLFFNLAHENHVGKTYFLVAGGQTLHLLPVSTQPGVLARERLGNAFLSAVPDDQITHFAANVIIPGDSVILAYVGAEIDGNAGTWSMSAVQLVLPLAAMTVAYARARNRTPSGPLPLSARRHKYGLAPAMTEQDLRDECVLFDSASHGATLIGLHPDLMSLEPGSAATVQFSHIARVLDTTLLQSKIESLGTALPQQNPGRPNDSGWATLEPLLDANNNPVKIRTGPNAGRVQYQPTFNVGVASLAGQAMVQAIPEVKDDPNLGADITSGVPAGDGQGMMWYRRDGRPNTLHSPAEKAAPSGLSMKQRNQNPNNGLDIVATSVPSGSSVQVTLVFSNSYLRYLGVFLQFLDAGGNVLNLGGLDEYGAKTLLRTPADHVYGTGQGSSDTAQSMFATMIGPEFTVMAIPVAAGTATVVFTMPKKASSVRVLTSGLGGTGSNTYSDTIGNGAAMTVIMNYGVTAVFAAAGAAPTLSVLVKTVVLPILNVLAQELGTLMAADINGGGIQSAAFWKSAGLTLFKSLYGIATGKYLAQVVGALTADLTVSVAEESIPVAGLIMAAVSAVVGIANIAHTSADIGMSPWTYVDDLSFTYDLSVALTHAIKDGTFPAAATACKVTVMIDDGTPHIQTFTLQKPVPATLPPVLFAGMPLGGNLNVSVAFSQAAISAGQDDILLGKGTTGLVANDGSAHGITIDEIQFPIGPTTTYEHKQKTELDDTDRHVWAAAAAPTVNAGNSVCGGAGTICGLRNISVRQATAQVPGYLGYAWQSQNSDASKAPSCYGAGIGQLDQFANLNTGADPESGHAASTCGLSAGGVAVAYSLLGHPSANFYLDPSDPDAPLVRRVVLDPVPQFDSPLSNQSWGALNFLSDTLLLHPSGRLVSINYESHKIETLRLPAKSMRDADAKVQLLAEAKCGQGSRPGLIDSPVAAAISADGVLLVLEAGNNRIQAFDLGANPVPYFTKQAEPHFLTLDQTSPDDNWQHLDMAVEYTGFIYVLSYRTDTFEYQLNIYHPGQTGTKPVGTTPTAMNAAQLTVDFWRNVYTLNYEVIQRQNPGNQTPPPVTEPSVSLWTPCNAGQTC